MALAAVLREGLPTLRVGFLAGLCVAAGSTPLSCAALSPLQEVNLSFGEITEAAAMAVAQAVADKPSMEKVDLNGTVEPVLDVKTRPSSVK